MAAPNLPLPGGEDWTAAHLAWHVNDAVSALYPHGWGLLAFALLDDIGPGGGATVAMGPGTSEVAKVSTNLGDLLLEKGQLAAALTHFRRALAVDQAVYGPGHPELFVDLMNLGMGLKVSGAAGESQAMLKQALAIVERHFGVNSGEARAAREGLAGRRP